MRSWTKAVWDGFNLHCPHCHQGRLHSSFLKINHTCPNCGEELHHHRADDAPPYFTITIVAHIVVVGLLIVERIYRPELWVHFATWLPLTVILTYLLMPRVKGAIVGLQWALKMHGFGQNQTNSD